MSVRKEVLGRLDGRHLSLAETFFSKTGVVLNLLHVHISGIQLAVDFTHIGGVERLVRGLFVHDAF